MAKAVFEYKGILIEQDPNNWIVKVPVQSKRNPGKKQNYDIGYYDNLKAALNAVFEVLVKKRLSQEVSHSVQELSQKIDLVKRELLQGISLNLDREITIRT